MRWLKRRAKRASVSCLRATAYSANLLHAALRRFPELCVVLVTIPQLRGPEFLNQFRDAWNRGPIHPAAGQLLRWPTD